MISWGGIDIPGERCGLFRWKMQVAMGERCADWHLQGVLSSSFADYEVNISLKVSILHASMSKPSVKCDDAVGDNECRKQTVPSATVTL